jgi:hypothetical protein
MVIKNSSKRPEQLPQEPEIKDIKKEIKQGYRKMLKADK